MNLEKCLESLNKKEYEKIRKIYSEEELSINDLVKKIYISFSSNGLIFTDEELDTLRLLSEKKEVKKVSKYLLKHGYVYKINDKYVLPDDLKFSVYAFFSDRPVRERKAFVLSFYMSSNGVLELDTLIKLMSKSGVKITRNEAISISKENDYVIDNDMIYLNKFVIKSFDKNAFDTNSDVPEEYKIFDLKEMLDIIYLKEDFFPDRLFELLEDKISDTAKVSAFTDFLSVFSFAEFFSMNTFDLLLEKSDIKLKSEEKEEIFNFILRLTLILPCWSFKGNSFVELQSGSDECTKMIKKMIKDAKKDEININLHNYIYAYLAINGIIEIDKLLDIFKEHHKIVLEKDLLLDIVSSDDFINEKNGYLFLFDDDHDMFKYLLNEKKKVSSYKIIDDFDGVSYQFDRNCSNLDELLLSYGIKDELIVVIRVFLLFGNLNKYSLEEMLSCYNVKLDSKKFSNLYKEINRLKQDFRLWYLNGYKLSEIESVNKKVKIGRNEKCPCGSGKKYKVCCGK